MRKDPYYSRCGDISPKDGTTNSASPKIVSSFKKKMTLFPVLIILPNIQSSCRLEVRQQQQKMHHHQSIIMTRFDICVLMTTISSHFSDEMMNESNKPERMQHY
jgi:hypothetical protein